MKKKILIIQEFFPIYRKPFFDLLAQEYDLTLVVSKANFSNINADKNCAYVKEVGNLKEIMSGIFFWQSDLLNVNFTEYDTIVLSAAPRNLSFLYLMFYLKIVGKQTIFWGQYWSATSTKIGFSIRMLLLRLASGVLFYTDEECDDYKKTFFGKNDHRPILGLNNGLDIQKIQQYRKNYDLNRIYNILFIGRLTGKSNLMQLVSALNILKFKDNVRLHIIGDGELMQECKKYVRQNNLEKNVIFYGSIIAEENIASIINECSLFVYPGDVGLSLIHAMSYGLPCIIHDNLKQHGPEVAALLQSGGGVFFEKNNVKNLAASIDKYFENLDDLLIHSKLNIEIIENKYNVISMVKTFNNLCEILDFNGNSNV